MSELKAKHVVDVYDNYMDYPCDERSQVYLKSEADKVIAEKDKQIDLYKRGWEESDKINAFLYKELRYHKYKRCLAMARWCASRVTVWSIDGDEKKADWYWKWKEKWKKLAEKFREACNG